MAGVENEWKFPNLQVAIRAVPVALVCVSPKSAEQIWRQAEVGHRAFCLHRATEIEQSTAIAEEQLLGLEKIKRRIY